MTTCDHLSYDSCLHGDECAQCLRDQVLSLLSELERLKAENARLAAAINETASVYGFTRPPECLRALGTLVAPTIELLEQHTFDEHGQPYQSPSESQIQSELARLRAVCGKEK